MRFPILACGLIASAALLLAAPTEAAAQCTNSCPTAFDGECDDGGPGSLYSICDLGSDCADCGPRVAGGGGLCTNTCSTSNDGECDDGGPGSLYSICSLGSDCNDCGPRQAGGAAPPTGGSMCTNTCSTSNDGECDDGGPGSLYSICGLGTDCNDCGPRATGGAVQQVAPAGGQLCTNTCSTSNDSECDDGGPGSLYSICSLGTDCNDCGPRAGGGAVQQVAPAGGQLCTNTCSTSNDNECDDGGPNSLYSICDYGSDCNDCGVRPPR